MFDPSVFFLQDFLDMMNPTEVFACENGTIFFYQDENLLLATGEIILFYVFSMFFNTLRHKQHLHPLFLVKPGRH